ncbi:MAG: VWA domain-containing protein, partial [Calditrichaeota bacterium]|nr:VWA domain-containing protein [Calditrichota bacterium]
MSVQRLKLQTILWVFIFGIFIAPAQSVRIGKTQISGVETGNWPDFQVLLNIENVKDTPISALKNWKFDLNWGAQTCSVLNAENPEAWLNQPSQVIMIVDNSTSMSGKTGFVEQAYKIFIDGVRKHTEVSIIRFQKPDATEAWGAEFIVQTSNSQYFMKDQNLFSSMTSRTFLYDATYQALSFIDNFIENGQKSVVVLSDGLDVGSSVSYSQLVQRATDMNIPLYFIDFSSRRDRNDKAKDLSSDTYGFYAASSNPKELTDIYFQILTQINNQVIIDAKYPVSGSAIPPNAELSINISDENGSVSSKREVTISPDRMEALR